MEGLQGRYKEEEYGTGEKDDMPSRSSINATRRANSTAIGTIAEAVADEVSFYDSLDFAKNVQY
jgi:hypothetical protein